MRHHSFNTFVVLFIALTIALPSRAGVITDSLKSNVLAVTKYYNVYLPSSYKNDTQAHYPILYLLHGLTDNHRAWLEKGQMDRVMDELINCGEIPPMVVIMPNAGDSDTRRVWNGYFNMPGWNYEDFFFQELLPTVEAKYRAGGSKEQRAIAGLSMGGGGSVGYAIAHSDMFVACYAMSAWLTAEKRENADVKDKMAMLSNAVHDHDPVTIIEQADEDKLNALRSVKWFLDCGDDDFLFDRNIDLYKVMRQKRFTAQLRVRDGSHNWEYWHNALRLCLPFVSRAFGK